MTENSTATTTDESVGSAGVEDPPVAAAEPRTLGELKKSFQEFGTSAHEMVTSRVQNFRSADGGTKNQSDVLVSSLDEALVALKKFVDSAKSTHASQKRPQKWNFATAPVAAFDKTLDDLFLAFLQWARVDESEEESYNVSKAFRRLEGYATWMDSTGRDLIDPPLTIDSLQDAFDAWKMTVSTDKEGRLVWWIDFAAIDVNRIKDLSSTDTLRLFVWLTHYLLFQSNNAAGMVVVQNMANLSFWKAMTLMPPQLGMKIDRFTIGVLPIQMKQFYMTDAPWWTKAIIKTTKAFLSKKMKGRIAVVDDAQVVLVEDLGVECIPESFPGNFGKLSQSVLVDQYFSGNK